MNISIGELKFHEINAAVTLVWKVFMEYEAPDYTPEGVDEFHKTIHNEGYMSQLRYYGAFLNEELIGVIATRSGGTHIALFFVEGIYHKQGVGKRLFQSALSKNPSDKMTVNSSPYAVPIYQKLGFVVTEEEQTVNSLRFTPMQRIVYRR